MSPHPSPPHEAEGQLTELILHVDSRFDNPLPLLLDTLPSRQSIRRTQETVRRILGISPVGPAYR